MGIEKRLKTRIVPPDGPIDADICFVGEAPGADEDYEGRPFVGKAGMFFDRCLSQVGIARSSVLVTNVFCQRPPGNKVGYFFVDKGCNKPTWEGEEHIEMLRMFLSRLKESPSPPNLLVALGATACRVLTGKKRITKWRGSVLPCTLVEGFKVYPMFHPSYVVRLMSETREAFYGADKKRQQNALPIFLLDLERVLHQSTFPEIRAPKRNHLINLGLADMLARLETLAESEGLCAVDIETLPGEDGPLLWFIGFSPRPDEAFTIPWMKNYKPCWSLDEEARLLVAISKVFLNPKMKKIFQNGLYDLSVLGRYYSLRVARGSFEDTMICHHARYPNLNKGLDLLTSIYTWEPYYKDEGKVHFGKRSNDGAEALYNCKDCAVTREIFPVLRRQAQEVGVWEGYKRSISFCPSLLSMMIRGVRLNLDKMEELRSRFSLLTDQSQNAVDQIVGEHYNLRSAQQKQALLYTKLRLPVQYNHKTKKPTTNKDALQSLQRKYPSEHVISHILDFQKYSKLHDTYSNMEIEKDGRIRTSYFFVSTWRLSSSASHFGGGGNLQNIPKRTEEGKLFRKLFIPDEGMLWGRADLSQAEARVVAWEAEDFEQIEAFLSGVDVHWRNAKKIFGLPKDLSYEPNLVVHSPVLDLEIESHKLRDIGKTVVHASNYGTGPRMLSLILARGGFFFPMSKCKALIEAHRAGSPAILEWQRKIRERVSSTRILISSYGRRREFLGRINDDLFRAAYAFSPQNTVGELIEDAMQRIEDEVPEADLLLNVHDEVDFQAPKENFFEVAKRVTARLHIPLTIHSRDLLIPVDFSYGSSWGDLSDCDLEKEVSKHWTGEEVA